MSAEMKPTGLHAKIVQAMGEIGRVPKRGENKAQGYKYARADDVAEVAREVLAGLGVAVYADVAESTVREITTKNGTAKVSCVMVAWTFVDSETKEERTVRIPGEGMDYGDKGVYKAMTGSLKYFLMTNFLIPTGEGDPELAAVEEPAARRKPPPPRNAAEMAKQAPTVRLAATDNPGEEPPPAINPAEPLNEIRLALSIAESRSVLKGIPAAISKLGTKELRADARALYMAKMETLP